MISLIEAKNFRCLRFIRQPLGPFHVLVGPNASGKTTFLDIVAFLGRLVSEGPEAAIEERTQNFQDLMWGRFGNVFELAVEIKIPKKFLSLMQDNNFDTIRYEVSIGIDSTTGERGILAERALLKKTIELEQPQRTLFPMYSSAPETILTTKSVKGCRTVISKVPGKNDNFYPEVRRGKGKGGWLPSIKLGPHKSALGNLLEDEIKFPVSTWLKSFLSEGIQKFILNSMFIRKASPPGQIRGFKTDGSNIPWVVDNLRKKEPENYKNWIEHLQTALPDLEDIKIIERQDDRHKYMMLCYSDGLTVPSWMASDGTLRLLALTMPAYLPALSRVYLIEEPENGMHPQAVETMFQSLSSVYDAQILVATHSPVILSLVEADKVLCFAKTTEGATDIVLGSEHPALKEWRGETNLSVLFAGGVLG